jgi:plasmid maintenance system antidote protein VapI
MGFHHQAYQTLIKRQQKIKDHAHKKWDEAGRPYGRDDEFWLAAESEIDQEEANRDMKRVRRFNRHVDEVIKVTAQANEILKEGEC